MIAPPLKSGISVVIPAYNVAGVINRVVEQVLAQSYQDFELLIIDDGSKDDTPQLLDMIALQDERIHIFHQVNSGVSAARNKGIAEASRRYITFVDADDEVHPDYLKHMVEALETNQSDLVIAGWRGVPDRTRLQLENRYFDYQSLDKLLLIRDLGITFCKVYKTELLKAYQIEFPLGMKLSEDAVFYYRYLRYAQSAVTIDSCDYFYYLPSGTNKYGLEFVDELRGLNAILEAIVAILRQRKWSDEVVERLHQRVLIILNRVVVSILSHPRSARATLYAQIAWGELLAMIRMPGFLKFCIRHRYFKTFELLRMIYQKLSHKNVMGLLGVE